MLLPTALVTFSPLLALWSPPDRNQIPVAGRERLAIGGVCLGTTQRCYMTSLLVRVPSWNPSARCYMADIWLAHCVRRSAQEGRRRFYRNRKMEILSGWERGREGCCEPRGWVTEAGCMSQAFYNLYTLLAFSAVNVILISADNTLRTPGFKMAVSPSHLPCRSSASRLL